MHTWAGKKTLRDSARIRSSLFVVGKLLAVKLLLCRAEQICAVTHHADDEAFTWALLLTGFRTTPCMLASPTGKNSYSGLLSRWGYAFKAPMDSNTMSLIFTSTRCVLLTLPLPSTKRDVETTCCPSISEFVTTMSFVLQTVWLRSCYCCQTALEAAKFLAPISGSLLDLLKERGGVAPGRT